MTGPATSPPPPREVIRAPGRGSRVTTHSPAAGDLYHHDTYARTLLASLIRAQLGVTISVLLPAAAILVVYPLVAVLLPSLATAHVAGLPLTFLILGGGIYPPIVLLGFWYVRRTEKVERRFVELLEDRD